MKPTIGRIVHYQLNEIDADEIARKRQLEAERRGIHPSQIGNEARPESIYPAAVVAVFDQGEGTPVYVNLQVQLDGEDTFWATSREEGTAPGTWAWPARV